MSKSSLRARVKYLLEGTKYKTRNKSKVDIIDGNAELFLEKARLNTYKTKSFNFLISFAEDKKELEEKLKLQGKTIKELYDEVIEQITAGYLKDELNILAIGHADTDNYHIHITIDSRNQKTDTQLYFQATRKGYRSLEVELWRNLERYMDLRYNLTNNVVLLDRGKALNEKIKELLDKRGEYKEKTRDEIKEEMTNILAELILTGDINSREELIEYLKSIEGLEINRIGKDYISIMYGNTKIRLKGGIYSDERFGRIKTEISRAEKTDRADIQRELKEFKRRVDEIQQKRIQRIEERFKTARARAEEFERKFIQEVEKHNLNTEPSGILSISSNWNRGRTIQLSKNEESNISSSNTTDRTREMEQRGELPRVKRPAPILLHRQKIEKSKNGYLSYSSIVEKLKGTIMNYEEKRKEELEAIKSIPPEDIIVDLGIPCVKRPSYYECRAIWRGDKNPSLSIFHSGSQWRWRDHGTGEGGSWIDLYMIVKGWDYITVVKYLRENFLEVEFTREYQSKNNSISSEPKILSNKYLVLGISEKPIEKPIIKRFLKEHRKIEHIPKWLKEVEYEIFDTETGKVFKYFGFGVRDEVGSYHIRYATDKLNVKERVINIEKEEIKSTYTHIRKNSNKIVVVEGFIDAIRIEELKQLKNTDILILNGVENINKALDAILKYKEIIIATDMDNAGDKVANIIVKNALNQKIYRLEFSAKDIDEAVKYSNEIKIRDITVKKDKKFKPKL